MARYRSVTELPDYVTRVGEQVFPPPYLMADTGIDIFLVQADISALNKVIDDELNTAWRNMFETRGVRHQFVATSDLVGFAFTVTNDLTTLTRPADGDADDGRKTPELFARQLELAVMVSIGDDLALRDAETAKKESWYLPFVLNDLPAAIATGREVYGYPKQYATFWTGTPSDIGESLTRPDPPLDGHEDEPWFKPFGRAAVEQALTVKAYDVTPQDHEKARWPFGMVPVLTVRQLEQPGGQPSETGPAPKTPVRPQLDLIPGPVDAVAVLTEGGPPLADRFRPLSNHNEFLDRLKLDLPFLFLRQFRDPSRGRKASYQGVVSAQVIPGDNDAEPLPGEDWAIEFFQNSPESLVPMHSRLFGTQSKLVPVVGRIHAESINIVVRNAVPRWETP